MSSNPQLFTIRELVSRIKSGRILAPKLIQRGYVWSNNKVLKLFESVIKKYPIGILILWKYDNHRELTNEYFNPLIKLDHSKYTSIHGEYVVIDGYQRLTSLILIYSGRAHVIGSKGGFKEKSVNIYYNPLKDIYDLKKSAVGKPAIPIKDILNNDFFKYYDIFHKYAKDKKEFSEIIDKLYRIKNEFESYMIPAYVLSRDKYKLLDVIDIFDRINSNGTKVQLNQIILAYLAAHVRNVAEDIFNTLSYYNKKSYKITIRSVIRALSYLVIGFPSVNKLIDEIEEKKVSRKNVEDMWTYLKKGIKETIEMLENELGRASLAFIPSDIPLIVPYIVMTKFKINKTSITSYFKKALAYWVFLIASYGYYISSTDSKLTEDLRLVNRIIDDKAINNQKKQKDILRLLFDRFKQITGKPSLMISYTEFMANSSVKTRKKFLLYVLLSINDAEDWYTSAKIKMLEADRINLHHIFPISSAKSRKAKEYLSRIGNLTFITDDTNRQLGAKLPFEYFEKLEKNVGRDDMKQKLQSHFIPYNRRLWKPNKGLSYNKKFIEEREKTMVQFINKNIIAFIQKYSQ